MRESLGSEAKEKKKVLFLTHSFMRHEKDVISPFLLDLAAGMQEMGFQVLVIVPHQKGLSHCQEVDGVRILRFRYGPDRYERLSYIGSMYDRVRGSFINRAIFASLLWWSFTKALRVVVAEQVDIIHAHWMIPSGLVGVAVASLARKPLVVTVHGTDIRVMARSILGYIAGRLVLRRAQSIAVVSNYLKALVTARIGKYSGKIAVVPMAVNTSEFERRAVRTKRRSRTILCVSRYAKQKKLDVLVDSCAVLKERGIRFHLQLIGEGPEGERLIQKIRELGLEKQVELSRSLVSQQELNDYYNDADLVVLPSVNEGLGLVLAEAQFCGVPVVGVRSGGIPDIIEHKRTGLLVPPGDPEALADAMEKLLTDRRLAKRLAENGYEYVRQNFASEAIAEKMLRVYEDALILHRGS